jgi:rhodanese-related sulfurtransferase
MKHSPRFLTVTDAARAAVRETTATEVQARLAAGESPLLVDVREDREWEAGRIPGSVHLGRGVLERDVERRFPDPGAELILICGGGFRSALAARSLAEMGYTNTLSLAGGTRGWQDSDGSWDAGTPPKDDGFPS